MSKYLRILTVWLGGLIACGLAHAGDAPEFVWLDVQLNGQDKGTSLAAIEQSTLWLEMDNLKTWGLLDIGSQVVRDFDGITFVAVNSIQTLSFQLDRAKAQLALQLDPALLPTNRLMASSSMAGSPEPQLDNGLHLNYDTLLSHAENGRGLASSAFAQLAGYYGYNLFISGFSWRRIPGVESRFLRLDSQWSRDLYTRGERINIGDVTSSADPFAVRYRSAGLQWKREFSLRPQHQTFATPLLTGTAELPSDVELLINGTRRARMQVPPGPFVIDQTPIVTGDGQAELILTNALGEVQIQQINYYVDPSLLRKGLLDFDLSLGWARQNFAIESFDYDALQVDALVRYGFSDAMTVEARSHVSQDYSNAEVRYVFKLGALPVTANLGAGAVSIDSKGSHELVRWGLSWQNRKYFAGIQSTYVNSGGRDLSPVPLQEQWLARAGVRWGQWNISLDQLYRENDPSDSFERQNVRLNRSFRLSQGFAAISLGGFRIDDSETGLDTGWQLSFSWTPHPKHRLAASTRQSDQSQWMSSYDYRDTEELGQQAQLIYSDSNDRGIWVAQHSGRYSRWHTRARAESRDSAETIQAGLQGAVGWLGGHWFLSRPISSSYALVKAGEHDELPIMRHNRVAARTDARGLALLPGLLPYQANHIRIDPLDVPLDSQINQAETQVTPAAGRGIFVNLSLSSAQAVELTLMRAPGVPVPAGAVIVGDGIEQRFYVGESGASYVLLDQQKHDFAVSWIGGSCRFSLRRDQLKTGVQPYIGAIPCQ